MKNHVIRNVQLIQTNKGFSQLKMKQKQWINSLLKEKYIEAYKLKGSKPTIANRDKILDSVYESIEEEGIWIPKYEVEKYFFSKISTYLKAAAKLDGSNTKP